MKRRGTSLMEVLIAIFVMALGLVSLLTLFPIGFVQMAKSVQDERAAQLAANATAYIRMLWKNACEASARSTPGGQPLFTDEASLKSFWSAMDDPNILMPEDPTQGTQVVVPTILSPSIGNPPTPLFPTPVSPVNSKPAGLQQLVNQGMLTGASYPVLVDPVGWEAASGSDPKQTCWVGFRSNDPQYLNPIYSIPRRRISTVAMTNKVTLPFLSKTSALRNCMLQDDMDFSPDGVANLRERVAQYSCAWLLRRDNNNKRTETNVTVVVYHRRSIETPSDEFAFHMDQSLAPGQPGGSDTRFRAVMPVRPQISGTSPNIEMVMPATVTLVYTATSRPPLRRGGWILDATMDQAGPANGFTFQQEIQGYYYRIVDFTETEIRKDTFQSVVQLETRLRPRQREIAKAQFPTTAPQPSPRLIIVQDRVLEVFDKGPLEMNSPSRIN